MTVVLNPYINFNGNAKEAMEFYKDVFGGELTMTTFKEGMPQGSTPDQDDLIMHAMLKTPNGLTLMGSDAMDAKSESRISISLSSDNSDEEGMKGYWEKFIAGGKVNQPLEKAPWGDTFGMCTDKFGLDWMVNIEGMKV
jgi:PhnB protein